MIITNKRIFIYLTMIIVGCMQPNEENIWSLTEEETLSTNGFCRNISVVNNIAYVAAGQSGVQIWDLDLGVAFMNSWAIHKMDLIWSLMIFL